jgi:hypothetical protein
MANSHTIVIERTYSIHKVEGGWAHRLIKRQGLPAVSPVLVCEWRLFFRVLYISMVLGVEYGLFARNARLLSQSRSYHLGHGRN